jgi:hypothetical protein
LLPVTAFHVRKTEEVDVPSVADNPVGAAGTVPGGIIVCNIPLSMLLKSLSPKAHDAAIL